jgi:hypothetical protein
MLFNTELNSEAGSGGKQLQAQHWESWGRISRLRPSWAVQHILGQQELHWETQSQKQTSKQKRATVVLCLQHEYKPNILFA